MDLECINSQECAKFKHHYDECAERVHKAEEAEEHHKGKMEDCVEEFFRRSPAVVGKPARGRRPPA